VISTNTYASKAAFRMRGSLTAAPESAHGIGSESVRTTLANPFGPDSTAVARVRDAKQAAPPRGVLH
jgi:hypothetical protein